MEAGISSGGYPVNLGTSVDKLLIPESRYL
jgi:hypothetical protein